jgi:hypothetical protein
VNHKEHKDETRCGTGPKFSYEKKESTDRREAQRHSAAEPQPNGRPLSARRAFSEVNGVEDFPREKLTDRPSSREEHGRKMTGRKILWHERNRVGRRRFRSTVPNQIFLSVIFLP